MPRPHASVLVFAALVLATSCSRAAQPASTTASAAGPAPAKQPGPATSHKSACALIGRDEMATLLGGPIGKPSADESKAGVTSCTYPPADAGSRAQAEVTIEWEHSGGASFEHQLAAAFGGTAVGRQVAHKIALGDSAAYSMEGVLSIRKGRALITVTLPMRPDSEERATAVGRRLVDQVGGDAAPADKTEDGAGQAIEALTALIGGPPPADAPKPPDEPPALPEGLVPDGTCPDVPADADPGIGAPASLVPLVEGLTLSQTWIPNAGDYEHEGLVQVTKIDGREISVTRSAPMGPSRRIQVDHRRICRSDLASARLYAPGTSPQTPDVMGGTTFFTLSQLSFRELQQRGETAHRFVHLKSGELRMDLPGTLKRERPSTYRIIVNDRPVELPVLELSGTLGKDDGIHPRGVVLNDPAFPILLDFGWDDYSVRFTKISFPEPSQLEASLEKERRVDVYGIYFDFASDALRPESAPVLKEIASVLSRNADWTLSINGHTDNIGGDTSNLDLSRRRSEAVRTALTQTYGISAARLTTSGFGASQPKATNDTIEGRAQNRRVELIRR
jgi:hypothetical protein